MTLEQLRIFAAVAARQHVTRAARDLNLTQSATSAAIAALENRYATKLFDRIGRRIELTEAGRLFLVEANAILARARDAEALLHDLADPARGRLAIAASQTLGTYWLPHLVHRFRRDRPGIAVAVEIGNTEFVAGRVRDGAVALGFIEGPVDDPALAVDPLGDDDLVLVAPRGTPADIDLASAAWVVREPGSGTRVAMEDGLAALGLDRAALAVALELPANEAVRTAVEAGVGLTILSRLVVAGALKTGALVEIAATLPPRRFHALIHRQRHAGRAVQSFLDLARAAPPLRSLVDLSNQ